MPFDNPRENPHQRLIDLEDKLRNGDFGFTWNYEKCETCALAVNVEAHGLASYDEIAKYYGITEEQTVSIFSELKREGKMYLVTVGDVCKQITKVLEKVLA